MQTAESRYDALVDQVEVFYAAGRLPEALGVLTVSDPELTPWAAELAHLRACVLGASGDPAAALQVLQRASAAGAWWQPSILTDDDDLAGLRQFPEFEQLVAISAERAAPDPTPPLVQVPDVPPVGVVVALHGAGQRATHAVRDWSTVLDLGYALVCAESSQRMSPMYRTWPDRDASATDIARALAALPAELQAVPVIAAGFSAGARVALDWALTAHPTQPTGVIAVAPALRALPESAAARLSPATILIGTDDDLLEVVDAAADRLTGFGCTIERVPGLGHAFPAGFDARLLQVLRPGSG